MQETSDIARNIVKILKALAKKIEENPDVVNDIGLEFLAGQKVSTPRKKAKVPAAAAEVDLFKAYAEGKEEGLRMALGSQTIPALKALISKNALLPPGSAAGKLKKEQLIELILKRVKERMGKGDVFLPAQTTLPSEQTDRR